MHYVDPAISRTARWSKTFPVIVGGCLLAACSATAPDTPPVAAASVGPAGPPAAMAAALSAKSGGAAQRVYVDPATGAFTSTPPVETGAKVVTTVTGAVQTWTTSTGATLVKIPGALQSVCATAPTGAGPADRGTLADCRVPSPSTTGRVP